MVLDVFKSAHLFEQKMLDKAFEQTCQNGSFRTKMSESMGRCERQTFADLWGENEPMQAMMVQKGFAKKRIYVS